jgi:hypothetical protein
MPATVNMGLDVRLSQDLAFLTFGVTNRFDVSVGLPSVHAAVASTAYNGVIYSGQGNGSSVADQCWCVNTFSPGSFQLTAPQIGQASLAKTGFGDMVLRFKDAVLVRPNVVAAIGADLRLPTGDAANFLGTGTTSVKPFLALSLYSKTLPHGIVLAPHVDVGWQFSGKSILGGTLQGMQQSVSLAPTSGTATVPVSIFGPPFTATKDYLPDIFSWAAGTEIALGSHNTLIVDFLGNNIGWIHGAQALQNKAISAKAPVGALAMPSGFVDVGRTSFGQYSGAFGYKVRIVGNLIFSFQELVRFDNNGLTARAVPLFGLGYSFN